MSRRTGQSMTLKAFWNRAVKISHHAEGTFARASIQGLNGGKCRYDYTLTYVPDAGRVHMAAAESPEESLKDFRRLLRKRKTGRGNIRIDRKRRRGKK